MVVTKQEYNDEPFGMHPAISRATANAVPPPQPQAQSERRNGQQGHEAEQFSRHEQESFALGGAGGVNHGQIDKNARQIKKSRKPTGNEDNVK